MTMLGAPFLSLHNEKRKLDLYLEDCLEVFHTEKEVTFVQSMYKCKMQSMDAKMSVELQI